MNHLLFGPRWMRLTNLWAAATVTGFAALGATVASGTIAVAGSGQFEEESGFRGQLLTVLMLVSLASLAGDLTISFAKNAIAVHKGSLDGAQSAGTWTIAACGTYGMVSSLVLLSAVPGIPLWAASSIVTLPPTALVIFRYPSIKDLRVARNRGTQAPAAPRNQRVVRKQSRAQRRSTARG